MRVRIEMTVLLFLQSKHNILISIMLEHNILCFLEYYGKITIRKEVVVLSYGRRKIFTDEAEITAENVVREGSFFLRML